MVANMKEKFSRKMSSVKLSKQRGQSLVEMAIATPLLIIMLIGVFEVGWAIRGYLVLSNVNREAVRFAVKVAQHRGHVSDLDLQAVRDAGYSEAEVIEIVQHVALNTWTNYINEVAKTTIDFPVIELRKAS